MKIKHLRKAASYAERKLSQPLHYGSFDWKDQPNHSARILWQELCGDDKQIKCFLFSFSGRVVGNWYFAETIEEGQRMIANIVSKYED